MLFGEHLDLDLLAAGKAEDRPVVSLFACTACTGPCQADERTRQSSFHERLPRIQS